MPLFFSNTSAGTLFWTSWGTLLLLEAGLILRDHRAEVDPATATDRGSLCLLVCAISVASLFAFVAAFWLHALRITTRGWHRWS